MESEAFKHRKNSSAIVFTLLIQLSWSAAAMAVFMTEFKLSFNSLLLHVTIVLTLLLISLCLSGGVWALASGPGGRWFSLLMLTPTLAVCFGLNLVYIVDMEAYRLWGRDVSLALIAHFIPHGGELMRQAGVPISAAAAGSVGLLVVTALPWSVAATPICESAAQIFWGFRLPRGAKGRLNVLASTVLLTVFLAILFPSGLTLINARAWEDEPLISLFYNRNPTFPQTKRRLRVAAEDRLAERLFNQRAGANSPNVLLLIVDDLRADHLPAYGYGRPLTPFIDGMMRSGEFKKVEMALSHGSESIGGILATLNSRQTDGLCVQNFGVLEAFRRLGYRVKIAYSGNEKWFNLASNYGAKPNEYLFHDGDTLHTGDDRQVLEAIAALPPFDGKPVFLFLHLMAVHWYGVADFNYDRYFPAGKGQPNLSGTHSGYNADWRLKRNNFYDNRILQMDGTVQKIFTALQSKGYTASMVGALLADHGEGIGEHAGDYTHGTYLFQENIRIPFFLYRMNLPAKNLAFASQLDAAPTLFEAAGFKPPPNWEGVSLFQSPEPTRVLIHDGIPLSANDAAGATYWGPGEHFKLIWSAFNDSSTEQMFDLKRDPAELKALPLSADPEIRKLLHKKVFDYYLKCLE